MGNTANDIQEEEVKFILLRSGQDIAARPTKSTVGHLRIA
jgi:hypothetical protein